MVATTVIVNAAQKITGTVVDKEVVANITPINYNSTQSKIQTIVTSGKDAAPSINVNITGLNTTSIPSLVQTQSVRNPVLLTEILSKKATSSHLNQTNIAETFSRLVNYYRLVQEPVNITQSIPVFTIKPLATDSAKFNSTNTKYINTLYTSKVKPTDNLNATSSFIRDFLHFGTVKSITPLTLFKAVQEPVSITQSIPVFTIKPLATDSAKFNSTNTKYINTLYTSKVKPTDNLNATSSFIRDFLHFGTVKSITPLTLFKAVSELTISQPALLVLEGTISDVLLLENGDFLSLEGRNSTIITVTQTVADITSLSSGKNILVYAGVAEQATRTVNYRPILTDQVYVTDDYLGNANIDDDQYVQFIKTVINTTKPLDTIYKQLLSSLTNNFNTQDTSTANTMLVKSSNITIAEQVVLFRGITQSIAVASNLAVQNSGSIYQQNYLQDLTYTQDPYVGTITTFV